MNTVCIKKVLISEGVCCISSFCLVQLAGKASTFSSLWNVIYGGLSLSSESSMLIVILLLLPIIVFPYMFSDIFCDELYSRLTYIFTRTAQRSRWVVKKTFELLGWTVCFVLIHALIFFLISSMRVSIDLMNFSYHQIVALLMNIWHLFLLSLIINFLSMKKDPCKVAISILTMHIGSFLFFVFFLSQYSKISIFVLPICQMVYYWHSIKMYEHLAPLSNSDFSVLYSVIYFGVFTFLTITITIKRIKKMDII